jgi:hypothetical protein
LHYLRYDAYGYDINGKDKRNFDDIQVIWPGNLTVSHRSKLVYSNDITEEKFTLYFSFDNDSDTDPTKNHWTIYIGDHTEFYWDLLTSKNN